MKTTQKAAAVVNTGIQAEQEDAFGMHRTEKAGEAGQRIKEDSE